MHKVRMNNTYHDRISEIEKWLVDNVGPGSRRYNQNTWMGTDDWYCFPDPTEDELESEDFESQDDPITFVFRRESDLLMFSLKWS